MKNSPFWIIDAFVGEINGRLLRGNPAAVVLLDEFAPDDELLERANEFNLSETAFVVPRGESNFDLRWLTPQVEVNLCGHATLATAGALLDAGQLSVGQEARFATKSGVLTANIKNDGIELNFPAQGVVERVMPEALAQAFGWDKTQRNFEKRYSCFRAGDDWMVAVHQIELEKARPDLAMLKQLEGRGVILTAVPEWSDGNIDFLSRFFGPRVGVDEDPVTGSAHTVLAPFWGERLGKKQLTALQLSPRGGWLELEVNGLRISIAGRTSLRAKGTLC